MHNGFAASQMSIIDYIGMQLLVSNYKRNVQERILENNRFLYDVTA